MAGGRAAMKFRKSLREAKTEKKFYDILLTHVARPRESSDSQAVDPKKLGRRLRKPRHRNRQPGSHPHDAITPTFSASRPVEHGKSMDSLGVYLRERLTNDSDEA